MYYAHVLWGSAIFRGAEQGEILTAPTVIVGGREMTPYLVGECLPSKSLVDEALPQENKRPARDNFQQGALFCQSTS